MPELIADLDVSIVDPGTREEYFANVVGEPRADGTWEAWLEFVPLTDDVPLVTGTETYQPSRADLLRWAEQLSDVFVQGAFNRAVELQRYTRAELLAIIDAYNLNPPKHSLARLTDRQLVVFIVTATEVQM